MHYSESLTTTTPCKGLYSGPSPVREAECQQGDVTWLALKKWQPPSLWAEEGLISRHRGTKRQKENFKSKHVHLLFLWQSVRSLRFVTQVAQQWRTCLAMQETQDTWVQSPGGGTSNPLQYLAWKSPGTEEPGGLKSMGSQRIGHNLAHTTSYTGYICIK